MNEISAEILRGRLSYDPETGAFTHLVSGGGRKAGVVAGGAGNRGYILISVRKKQYLAHRLAWLYMKGEWPPHQIDHRDLNRKNNAWKNLRAATPGQNIRNSGLRKTNTTGKKGVTLVKRTGKYRAQITADRKHYVIGDFARLEDAAVAYRDAQVRLHGEFAR